MPWKISEQEDGKYCVIKEGGEVVKCHESREKATAHMRALYANVHDSAVKEFSMAIVKATSKNGEMSWRSVNSDIEEDVYGERMSLELFADFKKHIENNDPIPEPFREKICEDDWCGGMPYVSVAHYKSGTGKINVPGEPKNVYIDGKAFKSTGILYDTPLGRAVYKSLKKDLVEKSQNPIRISIGFLDLEHSHGDKFTFVRRSISDKCPLCKEGVGDKIYKKGHLVHLALTRVPANPRTEMELEQKSMTTKLEDAKSVIEDEEVLNTLELKSQTENDVLVIKTEDTDEDDCPEGDEECKKKKMHMKDEKSTAENTVVSAPTPTSPEVVAVVNPPAELSPVDKSIAALKERFAAIKSQGLTGDAALGELQKNFDELGEVMRSEFTPKPSPEEAARKDLEVTLRSVISEMLPQALAQTVAQATAPLQAEIAELRALSQSVKPIKKEEVPQPRNISFALVQKQAIEKIANSPKDQFQKLADASVGLPVG